MLFICETNRADVPLIKAMMKKGQQIAQKHREQHTHMRFNIGFHAVPSMTYVSQYYVYFYFC